MISFKTLVAAAVVSFGASAAFAQTTTAPATKAPTATTAPATGTAKKAEKAPRSAESLGLLRPGRRQEAARQGTFEVPQEVHQGRQDGRQERHPEGFLTATLCAARPPPGRVGAVFFSGTSEALAFAMDVRYKPRDWVGRRAKMPPDPAPIVV